MPEPLPALFLDRDGTLIADVHYLAHPDQVRLLPTAADAVRRINELGIPAIVVTNQAGVARGYFPESRIAEVHARLDELLHNAGARIDGYYVCPHHPDGVVDGYRLVCNCRKPEPGLLLRAASERGLDLARSCLIGDKPSDMEAGARAGCRTVLVRTGYGAGASAESALGVADTLLDAVELWLRVAQLRAGSHGG
jgi:D-glycero-D-manno-heptose 1,7-bisphosphate phosphatase